MSARRIGNLLPGGPRCLRYPRIGQGTFPAGEWDLRPGKHQRDLPPYVPDDEAPDFVIEGGRCFVRVEPGLHSTHDGLPVESREVVRGLEPQPQPHRRAVRVGARRGVVGGGQDISPLRAGEGEHPPVSACRSSRSLRAARRASSEDPGRGLSPSPPPPAPIRGSPPMTVTERLRSPSPSSSKHLRYFARTSSRDTLGIFPDS